MGEQLGDAFGTRERIMMRLGTTTASPREPASAEAGAAGMPDDDLAIALRAAGASTEDVERYLAAGSMRLSDAPLAGSAPGYLPH